MSTTAGPIRTATTAGVFNKSMKYDSSALPRLSSQTSLMELMRSQGHAMLGVEQMRPLVHSAAPLNTNEPLLKPHCKSKSKPIRIVASQHAHQDEEEEIEDPLSSSAELERFYDQATWRMYILIQSARIASEPPAVGNRIPTTAHSHAPYAPHHSQRSSHAPAWTTQCPPELVEEDMCFDLEL